MAIVSLDKTQNEPAHGDGVEKFRAYCASQLIDNYCDKSTFDNFIRHGVSSYGVESKKGEIILETELDSRLITNEKKLIQEMEAILYQFTQSDKKLDNKERDDALQMVCKPRSGYIKGLKYEIAEGLIISFCRQHRVKIKKNLFQWVIP